MQMSVITANSQVFFIQDTPGRNGELHHRHQCMYLTGTNNQLLVQLCLVYSQERTELASADHVRASISVP